MARSLLGSLARFLAAAAIVGGAALGASAVSPAAGTASRVSIFGDSSAEVLDYVADAKQYLARGFDVDWQLRVCRRLVQLSCPYQGVRPPTVLDVVHAAPQGGLGSIAVVDVGYNDYVDQYQDDMDTVIKALLAKGVQHVIWATMHEVRDDYRNINATIRTEAARWPQVVIADWNAASQGQDWFNSDGIHLNSAGAWGLARLLRPLIVAACTDPCQPPPTPAATVLYVIRATSASVKVGKLTAWQPPQRGTYAQAVAAFGPATSCRILAGRKSRATWSSLGLSIQFIRAAGAGCATSAGTLVQTLTATGSRWTTSRGLAVGDPAAKVTQLYPAAVADTSGYRLLKMDRLKSHAVLTAVVSGGRVAALTLGIRSDS